MNNDQNIKRINILITGGNGFVGKNLYYFLKENLISLNINNIFVANRNTAYSDLKQMVLNSDFIFNFAGINRPKDENEFFLGNVSYLQKIVDILNSDNKKTPIMLSSSIQSLLNNPYGLSKKQAEDLLIQYNKKTTANIYIYRFQNIFGKWSKPNYNSVVATFCYNISRDIPININDENKKINLVYIDDILFEMKNILLYEFFKQNINNKYDNKKYYYDIDISYQTTVLEIANIIKGFKNRRIDFYIPNCNKNSLEKKLYSTYLSFLEDNNFKYELKMNIDDRGYFTEILKTQNYGQFSVNRIKPGIIKGNHYHNSKNEKFLVVSGKAIIQFRKLFDKKIITYEVSEDKLEVIDIPCGYTHSIKNIGDKDVICFMWANEVLDKNNMDTYYLKV